MYMRDRAGLTFLQKGRLVREVSRSYAEHYDHLMAEGGLYHHLTKNGWLVKHTERGLKYAHTDDAYRVILPQAVPLETYPYEWGFSQWKTAALHVLDVAQAALAHGMTLRDARIDSVQFSEGEPIWTDTLAFAIYREGQAWAAYPQFIAQYLAPLALMSKVDVTLGRLLQIYPEGVPLALASSMLPGRTRVHFGLVNHIHAHGKARNMQRTTRDDLMALFNNLRETVESLHWTSDETPWDTAAHAVSTEGGSFDARQRLLRDTLGETQARTVWDLNAGQGTYSRIAANEFGVFVAAFNRSPHVAEQLWHALEARERAYILPLLVDWANPSPGLGWLNRERRSIGARANADVALVMGLVHQLALKDGITFPALATKFARMAPTLLIEFIPGSDPQMIAMMESGQDLMTDYTQENFEAAFSEAYDILRSEPVTHTPRTVYAMRRRS